MQIFPYQKADVWDFLVCPNFTEYASQSTYLRKLPKALRPGTLLVGVSGIGFDRRSVTVSKQLKSWKASKRKHIRWHDCCTTSTQKFPIFERMSINSSDAAQNLKKNRKSWSNPQTNTCTYKEKSRAVFNEIYPRQNLCSAFICSSGGYDIQSADGTLIGK